MRDAAALQLIPRLLLRPGAGAVAVQLVLDRTPPAGADGSHDQRVSTELGSRFLDDVDEVVTTWIGIDSAEPIVNSRCGVRSGYSFSR